MLAALLQAAADPKVVADFERQVPEITKSLSGYAPEVALSGLACLILLVDLVLPLRLSRAVTGVLTLLGLVAVGVLVWKFVGAERGLFLGMVATDNFARFLKLVILGGTAATVLLTALHDDFRGWRMGEYWSLVVASVLGMFLMVSATDFLMMYIAIEAVSIASFVLVGYTRSDRRASEASLKYVVYGAMASGLMLYGLSFFYAMTGTTAFADLPLMMERLGDRTAVAAAALLAFAGIGYKIAAVPMHFWCPDVYEGAPTPITAWLSVTSKVAGLGLLVRVVQAAVPAAPAAPGGSGGVLSWTALVAALSAATMTLGNLSALAQTNVKRMLAYSSIAHAGYVMMGVALAGTTQVHPGMQAVAFYLLVYAIMNLGAFAVVILVRNASGSEEIADYKGLGWRHPVIGAAFAVFLFGLIGVPPTAGFVGKVYLFLPTIEGGYVWLAVLAAVNTAISVGYYAGVLKVMYLDQAPEGAPALRFGKPAMATAVALAVPVIVLGLFFTPISEAVAKVRTLQTATLPEGR
ncbi:MAG: NADH-quinone oxidoreductase subunit N [Planctomycetales bacterium]|nr:NADH-quinone oxidoreductase subunit N [Planctomycetales bacterium]